MGGSKPSEIAQPQKLAEPDWPKKFYFDIGPVLPNGKQVYMVFWQFIHLDFEEDAAHVYDPGHEIRPEGIEFLKRRYMKLGRVCEYWDE